MSPVSMSNLQRSVWPQSHVKGAEPDMFCQSADCAGVVVWIQSCRYKEEVVVRKGAGQRGRKRKTGSAAMFCRDKVTPLQDRYVHE